MKTTLLPYDCNLGDEIPKEVKLEVYKKALEIIKEDKPLYGLNDSLYLCLLLPCILWDLKSFSYFQPNGKNWLYDYTKKSFQEINYREIQKLKTSSNIKERRIKELENAIAKLQ